MSGKLSKRRQKNHSAAHLAAIVDSSFDAIISTDLSGTIASWNKAAERLFGFSVDQAIGQQIFIIIPKDRHNEEIDIIRRLKLGETIETFGTVRKRKDGEPVQVSITVSPITDKRGKIIGASKIARDLSEVKENERRLRVLMREINHRVKNQYAVILSVISQTAARSAGIQDFEKRVRERIMGLSHSHDLLSSVDWAGVELRSLITHQVQPFNGAGEFSLSGPDMLLDANAVLNIGMALHELITNRVQFADPDRSSVAVTWGERQDDAIGEPAFQLTWEETAIRNPDLLSQGNGFGSLVLKRIVASALGGHCEWKVDDDILTWRLVAPLSRIKVRAS